MKQRKSCENRSQSYKFRVIWVDCLPPINQSSFLRHCIAITAESDWWSGSRVASVATKPSEVAPHRIASCKGTVPDILLCRCVPCRSHVDRNGMVGSEGGGKKENGRQTGSKCCKRQKMLQPIWMNGGIEGPPLGHGFTKPTREACYGYGSGPHGLAESAGIDRKGNVIWRSFIQLDRPFAMASGPIVRWEVVMIIATVRTAMPATYGDEGSPRNDVLEKLLPVSSVTFQPIIRNLAV